MSARNFSITRLINSFGFAIRGISASYKGGQINIIIHTFLALVAILLGVLLSVSSTEWIVLILCIGLVISAEIFNSSIEKLVDLVSPEWNEKAGQVKDMAAGAVLLLATTALIVGVIIFLPKLIAVALF